MKLKKTVSGTRIHRLSFTRAGVTELYAVKCADSVHPNPTDILIKGLLLVVKIGLMRGVDCLGRDLSTQYGANSGKGFNSVKLMVCGDVNQQSMVATKTYATLIKEAHNIGMLYRKNNPNAGISGDLAERKLPYLIQDKHNNQPILNDGERYYINDTRKCENCPELVVGRHYLTVSSHGKVTCMTTWQPPEDITMTANKKPLCPACNVRSISPAELPDTSDAGKEVKRSALWPRGSGFSPMVKDDAPLQKLVLTVTCEQAIEIFNYLKGGKL